MCFASTTDKMPYKVLVLEGDPEQRVWLSDWLAREFVVDSCGLAREALEKAKQGKPDLLVLAVDVPDMPGMSFLAVLRDTDYGHGLPVIAVAPERTEEGVLRAFDLGVEDYLVRPFDPRELVARCRTVLRRRYERGEYLGAPLSVAGVEIDPGQRRCRARGKRVTLRPREFALLEILMRKAGRVLTRAYLLETVWDMSSSADTRAVDVMVSRLRKHLGRHAGKMIETISKMGYCFASPE